MGNIMEIHDISHILPRNVLFLKTGILKTFFLDPRVQALHLLTTCGRCSDLKEFANESSDVKHKPTINLYTYIYIIDLNIATYLPANLVMETVCLFNFRRVPTLLNNSNSRLR